MARKKTSEGNMYASSYIGRGSNGQKWIKKKEKIKSEGDTI
jgi:hypothetical protein